jgi:hypothetical protein
MIAVFHRRGNATEASMGQQDEGQSQWVSGCFIGWLTLDHDTMPSLAIFC